MGSYYCPTIASALIGNSLLNTSEIKNSMRDCVYGSYDYYNVLMQTGDEVLQQLLLSTGGDTEGSGDGPKDPGPYLGYPTPPVEEDDSWTDTKADCVKDKLEAGGDNSILNKLLNGFNLSTSTINLTFYVGNTDYRGNPVPNGKCIFDPNTNRMSVYISDDRLSASSLEVARTILHECFHAYLYGKLYESDIHNGLAPEPDFEKDFNNYANVYGSSGGSNSAQHNYMATMYVSIYGRFESLL